jgi:hypothetical protein
MRPNNLKNRNFQSGFDWLKQKNLNFFLLKLTACSNFFEVTDSNISRNKRQICVASSSHKWIQDPQENNQNTVNSKVRG